MFGLQTLLGGWMQNHLKVWTKENRVWAWTIPEPYHQRNINNLVKATFHSFPLGLIFYLFQKLFADNTASCNAGDIVEQIILCPKQLHSDSSVLKLNRYFQTFSFTFIFTMFLLLLIKMIIDPIIDPAEAHLSHCAGGNLAFTLLPICPDPSHPNNLIHLFLVKNNCLNDNSTWPRIFRETLPSPASILSSLVMRIKMFDYVYC